MRRVLIVVVTMLIGSTGEAADSLYALIEPQPSTSIGCWGTAIPAYNEVFGYSSLGHVFLRNSVTQEYAVLHPLKKSFKSYGTFSSIAEFQTQLLDDEGFASYVLRPAHVVAIRKRLGKLGTDQIYIPEPYPFLGGTDAPKTYKKGNVWVFLDLVAQFLDVCEQPTEPNKSLERTSER